MLNRFKKLFSVTEIASKFGDSADHDTDTVTQLAINKSTALRDQGNTLLNNGKLEEAASCFKQAIALNPHYAEAYTNLGIVFQTQGNPGEATALYQKAIEFKPNLIAAHLNLATCLMHLGQIDAAEESLRCVLGLAPEHATVEQHVAALQSLSLVASQRGDFSQAESLLQRALELLPDNADIHNSVGSLLMQAEGLHNTEAQQVAETFFRRALALQPDFVDALHNLGKILLLTKRYPEARMYLRRALELQPNFASGHFNFGLLLVQTKQLSEAEKAFRRTLELNPNHAEAHNDLGNLLMGSKRLYEAEQHFNRALELNPEYAGALNNLALMLIATKCYNKAEATLRRALELVPEYTEAYINLANMFMESNRLPEAEKALRLALKLKPDFAEVYNNLGCLLEKARRLSEASACYRRAHELKPDYPEAPYNLSLLLLSLGQFADAWPYYEYRYHPNLTQLNSLNLPPPYPQWRGEPLQGKSLVIWPEQGYGDFIQFVRYTRLLKEQGVARLTMFAPPPLKLLLETAAGVDEVITDFAAIPPHDYWSFLLSLPLYFCTTLKSIPADLPYLHALPTHIERWRNRLELEAPTGKFKVGLVWKGSADQRNDANRSLPGLLTLAPLWSIPEIAFFSLQKGQGEEEANHPTSAQPIISLGSDIKDFSDTAAIIAQLDLVISVCTSVAHLTGAMGKPCWMLITSINPCWRWLRERGDSPWYPTMRLFRQEEPGNWNQPVESIRRELLELTHDQ